MNSINRLQTQPLKVPRTRRNHAVAIMTSLQAGKMMPIAAIPMLREDALTGRLQMTVEMSETTEMLMNPVHLRVTAYVVPLLAFERFEGSRDQFDRSYMGEPKVEGGTVVPFFDTSALAADAGTLPLYKYLGLHGKAGQVVNRSYQEAYNLIWNMRARNRSMEIPMRLMTDTSLAPAFWQHSRFAHVLPDFDQAVIDGEVVISAVGGRAPVKGLGLQSLHATSTIQNVVENVTGANVQYAHGRRVRDSTVGATAGTAYLVAETNAAGVAQVFAEMEEQNVSISLAKIEMAKRTQAFAKLREQYEGYDDEWIIDMLMSGLTIPDQNLKQPILIADQTVRFSQAKRYATDAGNLAESAVSGVANLNIALRVPKLNTGGVVMVLAEPVPEQLFERQQDPWWVTSAVDQLPEFLRDTLDPEKVDIVKNGEVDASHATPNATFGYAPMNWKWNASGPRVAGKFYRSAGVPGSDEVRQRLWAVENLNPVLSEDFYVVKSMHTKPFLDQVSDPFEAVAMGNMVLEGNTVFGGVLVESTTNYDKVLEKAPVELIDKGA